MRWLLDYASQQAGGYAVWGRDTDHIEKGFVFGGMPARNGVTAALLVRAGWNGVDDVFSGDDNFFRVNAPKANPAVLVDELGERYEIVNTDIKKWTVGTPIQAPLDAPSRTFARSGRSRPTTSRRSSCGWRRRVGAVVDNRDIPDICLQHMVAVMLIDKTLSLTLPATGGGKRQLVPDHSKSGPEAIDEGARRTGRERGGGPPNPSRERGRRAATAGPGGAEDGELMKRARVSAWDIRELGRC